MIETDFQKVFSLLTQAKVDFILIGGMAAIVHGSNRATYDIDVVYSRAPENLQRLADCLAPYQPYLRGAPPGLPFKLDPPTLKAGLNFTLITTIGYLDLLGEAVGGGTYEKLIIQTAEIEIFGHKCRCVTLEKLIEIKRAAGRPKDFEAIAELEKLLQSE